MTAKALIPLPDVLPVPWEWFQVLLIFTFILHLLLMNVMLGNILIAFFSGLTDNKDYLAMEKEASRKIPYTIAFTVNLGVAPLLFLQVLYGHFIYTSSVLMAVYWLSVVAILIIAYYCAYIYDFKFECLAGSRVFLIGLCAALMLLIAFIFTSNMTLMLVPANWKAYFSNPHGTIFNLSEPTLIPRYLHFVTASLAVGGLSQAILWKIKVGKGVAGAERRIAIGMKWFFRASVVQLFWGIWFLFSLPADVSKKLFSGDMYANFLLAGAFCCVLLILFFGIRRQVWAATASTVATIATMVLIRDMVRSAYLKPFFTLTSLKVNPQYSPMILFLVSFVIGLIVVAYMLKLAATGRKAA